ncbi:hypothetical protein O181_109582 [Austropuccinia psidii MF-1]|uniref:Uncharacterized protein n=1 Tax=Austropuccinia psidii MF-1 TaxID=1389203 RepID=A0A9Q3JY53_9BASI|nr:hypothetical protein [Austropuccinia psidii MF-1]
MPEPQRTDVGSTEGEESMRSPAMALNLGPNPSPKTFPAILGKFKSLCSWTLSMGLGHLGEEMVHGHFYCPMDPLEFWPRGSFSPWTAIVTPTAHGP